MYDTFSTECMKHNLHVEIVILHSCFEQICIRIAQILLGNAVMTLKHFLFMYFSWLLFDLFKKMQSEGAQSGFDE